MASDGNLLREQVIQKLKRGWDEHVTSPFPSRTADETVTALRDDLLDLDGWAAGIVCSVAHGGDADPAILREVQADIANLQNRLDLIPVDSQAGREVRTTRLLEYVNRLAALLNLTAAANHK